MKHNFYQLKKSGGALPKDVNLPVEAALEKLFRSPELSLELNECREKRRFCDVAYGIGEIGCEVQFVRGIIPKYFLVSRKKTANGGQIVSRRSVQNDNLDYPKDKE